MDFQQQLALLANNYLKQLPAKLTAIEVAFGGARKDEAQCSELRRLVHGLAGSGTTFGFPSITEAAHNAEEAVRHAQDPPADQATWDRLDAALKNLADVIRAVRPTSHVRPPGQHLPDQPVILARQGAGRRVFVVDDNPEQGLKIASAIKVAGYVVSRYETLDTFIEAVLATPPDAVVVDMAFPEGKHAGAEAMQKIAQSLHLPTFYISNNGDFQARLAAMRTGATHYLTKPVDIEVLLRGLDEATRAAPPEPYRILLVDDDAEITAAYRLHLEHAHMQVEVVNDPMQVMDTAERFDPDVVVLDVMMPGCNGLELAAVLRQQRRYDSMPILFLSAEGDITRQLGGLQVGGDEYLVKPVEDWRLIPTVRARAKRSREVRELRRSIDNAMQKLTLQQQALDEHAIVSVADAAGNITYINQKFCEISQYAPDELLGKNHRILNSGVHPKAFWKDVWQQISAGHVWHGEVCNKRKDGALYWVETTITPSMDGRGRPYQYISIRTEITRVKVVEEEARQARKMLQVVIDALPIYVYWKGPDLRYLGCNQLTARLAGLESPQQIIGKSDFDLTWGHETAEAYRASDRYALSSGRATYGVIDTLQTLSGRTIWLDTNSIPLLDETGKTVAVLGTVADITQLKQVEDSLRISEDRLNRSQGFANIGSWDWNIETGDLWWSERVAPLLGLPPGEQETSYAKFLAAVHPDDRTPLNDAVDACVRDNVEYNIEHRVVWPDGSIYWMHESGAVTRDADGKPLHMLGVVQDITQRKHIEEALVKAKEDADTANKAKSEFLSQMSHELRTPLNAIIGFAQLMESDTETPLTPDQHENIEQVLKGGWHLLELINEVLDLARVESGQMQLSMEAVDWPVLLNECLTLITPMAETKLVSIDASAMADGCNLQVVIADRMRLKQVLLNLLSNAVKYNKHGGHIGITYSEDDNAGMVRISISDTGAGIAPDMLSQMFVPFNRLGAEKTAVEGTGIGLVVTKRLIEVMGGRIEVESQLGEGSKFTIALPWDAHTTEIEIDAKPATNVPVPGNIKLKRMLYVEDNPANQHLVERILSRRPDIELMTMMDATSGLEMARFQKPDLIMLDINLPDMDGFQLLRLLRAHQETAHIPVIALSANAMERDIQRGLDAGFSLYLTKPIQVNELLAALDRLLLSKEG